MASQMLNVGRYLYSMKCSFDFYGIRLQFVLIVCLIDLSMVMSTENSIWKWKRKHVNINGMSPNKRRNDLIEFGSSELMKRKDLTGAFILYLSISLSDDSSIGSQKFMSLY